MRRAKKQIALFLILLLFLSLLPIGAMAADVEEPAEEEGVPEAMSAENDTEDLPPAGETDGEEALPHGAVGEIPEQPEDGEEVLLPPGEEEDGDADFATMSEPGEEPSPDEVFWDAAAGLYYKVVNGAAYVTGCDTDNQPANLVIPATLGGYPVRTIINQAFSECNNIETVTITEGVNEIGVAAFSACLNLKSVTIPESTTSISGWAFMACQKLESITIPGNVTGIGMETFRDCTGLTSVSLPNSVITIDDRAFMNCSSLTAFHIPRGVTTFGENVFTDCKKLTAFTVDAENANYSACDGVLYSKDMSTALLCPPARSDSVTVPSGVKSIGSRAFCGCVALTEVVLPDSLTAVEAEAFANCASLGSIVLPDSMTAIGERAFQYSGLTDIEIPGSVTKIEAETFAGCVFLESAALSNGVTVIGEKAFCGCAALTEVVLPDGLTAVEAEAFADCGSLGSIVLPDSVTAIGERVFYKCTALSAVGLPDGIGTIVKSMFNGCSALESFTIPESVTSIGEYAFARCSSLLSVEIPNSVTAVGRMAFYGCSSLTGIEIPNSVTAIEEYTFHGCSALTGTVLPDSITAIGRSAFYGCSALKDITLPSGLSVIENNTFGDCSSLSTVTIPESVTSIGEQAFHNCTALASVGLPGNIDRIEILTFSGCDSLTGIAIPSGVTAIGEGAFQECSRLKTVRLPNSVVQVARDAFNKCPIETVYYAGTEAQRSEIEIGKNNTSLTNASWLYIQESGESPVVAFERENIALRVGEEATLALTDPETFPAGVILNWKVDKDEVAEITESDNGHAVITAKAVGTAWVSVTLYTTEGQFSARCRVKVAGNWELPDDVEAVPMALDREYIILPVGGEATLTLTEPESLPPEAVLVWRVDDSTVARITASDNGCATVKTKTAGIAWLSAELNTTKGQFAARCRIDVTESAVLPEVTGVSLVTKKAEVEVFKTEYTRITVAPNLKQNVFTASLVEDYEVPEIEDGQYAIESAVFDDQKASGINEYFKLQVVDDRTLEIIPTAAALQAADAKDKALKGSYKTAIKVTIDGEEFPTQALTLTVKKSMPGIRANTVKLNSFVWDEQPVVFTGGTVTKILAVSGLPGWLTRAGDEAGELTLAFAHEDGQEPQSQKETVKLTVDVEAEGWAAVQTVPVTVAVAPILPKVTFSSKTVTINPTFGANKGIAAVGVTVSPADYLDRDEVSRSFEITENGNGVDDMFSVDMDASACPEGSGKTLLAVSVPDGFNAEKARTFRFTIKLGGKEFPLTVKTLQQSKAALSIGAKAKGTIDNAIPNSPVTLDVTLKNTSTACQEYYQGGDPAVGAYTVEILRSDSTDPVNTFTFDEKPERFLFVNSGLTRITLTKADVETGDVPFDPGCAYRAKITVSCGDAETATASAEVRIPTKGSAPDKVPLTVTAKTGGKIDVLDPDSVVLLTPTIKNGYGIDLKNPEFAELKYYVKDGKEYTEINGSLSGLFTEEPNKEGTAFLIRMNPGYGVNHKTDRFFVKLSVKDPSDNRRTADTKYLALPLMMGKAKITQSATALTFLKKDINSSGSITLGTDNPACRIAGAVITNDTQGLYRLTEIGYGRYVITCTDRMTTKAMKNTTLRIAVTFAGNNSGNPNATLSLRIGWV